MLKKTVDLTYPDGDTQKRGGVQHLLHSKDGSFHWARDWLMNGNATPKCDMDEAISVLSWFTDEQFYTKEIG